MSKVYTSADQLIGHTPLLELTHLEKKYKIDIPLDEAITIVLILLLNQLTESENKPVLLIAMHGKNVASSLTGVVK